MQYLQFVSFPFKVHNTGTNVECMITCDELGTHCTLPFKVLGWLDTLRSLAGVVIVIERQSEDQLTLLLYTTCLQIQAKAYNLVMRLSI